MSDMRGLSGEKAPLKFGVKAGWSGIVVGRLNKANTAFMDKEHATDLTLSAVGEYVRDHFGGHMEATFPGMGFDIEVIVKTRDEGARPGKPAGDADA